MGLWCVYLLLFVRIVVIRGQLNVSLTWTTGSTTMPAARMQAFGGYNSDKQEVWIFGGEEDVWVQDTIFIMDTTTNEFSTSSKIIPYELQTKTQSFTQIHNVVWYIHDQYSPDYLHAIDMNSYNPSYPTAVSELPGLLQSGSLSDPGCMTAFGGKIFIVGGNGLTSIYRGTLVYDINTGNWTYGPNLNTYRDRGHSCNVADGAIYVLGGWDNIDGRVPEIEKWDFIQNNDASKYEVLNLLLLPARQLHASWDGNDQNPDYRLVEIHAANPGFESKMHKTKGSFMISKFVDKMTNDLQDNKSRFIHQIFDEIQDELQSKQQTKNTYSNGTRYCMLNKNVN